MSTNPLDFTLTLSVLGLLGKVGWDSWRERKKNGHSSTSDIKLALIAEREEGVRQVKEGFKEALEQTNSYLKESLDVNKEANKMLAELVYTERARRQ